MIYALMMDVTKVWRSMLVPLAAIVCGCAQTSLNQEPPAARAPILVTDYSRLPSVVGERVRVEGEVANSKQPSIAGVDVDLQSIPVPGTAAFHEDELRGKRAWAEGVVIQTVVTPDEVDNSTQNRGAGTFYSLIDPMTGRLAVAHGF
jgi:hypothetical protein